jgi:hypothetical protein
MNRVSFEKFFVESVTPKKQEELETFITKRAAGAEKIAKQATVKGGLSCLTAAHFHAKKTPYNICLKKLGDKLALKSHINNLLKKLESWEDMSQMEFQKVMGQLEVYGEVALQVNKPKEY